MFAVMNSKLAWRTALATALATLAALAALHPRSPEELLRVPGVGPVKASRYGPTLLALLCDQAAAG